MDLPPHRRKIRFSFSGPPRARAGGEGAAPSGSGEPVLSVGELTRGIRRVLESTFPVIAVRGEVCAVSQPRSGHIYFDLRDDCGSADAQIAVVLWRDDAIRLRFRIEEGLRAIVRGRLAVYEPRGCYQIVAERVEPAGAGEMALALERLRRRLAEEGLFAAERKRPLPFLPRRIGVITSPTGAALRDILRSIYRRHPGAWVRVVPARVQGEGSAEEIVRALARISSPEAGVDVVILGRGGGSPEDLWTFNEERLVRAVAACPVPTVSAVGHEIDFTLCDFAADVRAQTPTHAGDLVVPDVARLRAHLDEEARRLVAAEARLLERARSALEASASRRVLRAPGEWIARLRERVEGLGKALEKTLYTSLERWQNAVHLFSAQLDVLNPLNVLRRGYSVVFNCRGNVVRRAGDLRVREEVRLLLGEGEAQAEVLSTKEDDRGNG